MNDASALRCAACGADLVPAEPTGEVPLERRSLALWALLLLPGLAVVAWGLFGGGTWAVVAGLALLLAPLFAQLFLADWGDVS